MYCRTCGKKLMENAEVCVNCGCKPLIGRAYCQNCGAKTIERQELCTQCGARLKSTMTVAQKKETAENAIVKIIGTVLLVFGCLVMIGFLINGFLALTADYLYEQMDSLSSAGTCALVGVPCIAGGIALRKKAKRT